MTTTSWTSGSLPQKEGEYHIRHQGQEATVRLVRVVDWTGLFSDLVELEGSGNLRVEDMPELVSAASSWEVILTGGYAPFAADMFACEQWRSAEAS